MQEEVREERQDNIQVFDIDSYEDRWRMLECIPYNELLAYMASQDGTCVLVFDEADREKVMSAIETLEKQSREDDAFHQWVIGFSFPNWDFLNGTIPQQEKPA